VGGEHHAPAALSRGKAQYPFYRGYVTVNIVKYKAAYNFVKANWISHILSGNCLLKQVIEGLLE
jgi:hypothetical protein